MIRYLQSGSRFLEIKDGSKVYSILYSVYTRYGIYTVFWEKGVFWVYFKIHLGVFPFFERSREKSSLACSRLTSLLYSFESLGN